MTRSSNRRRFSRVRAQLRMAIRWPDGLGVYFTLELSANGALVEQQLDQPDPVVGATGLAALVIDGQEHEVPVTVIRTGAGIFALRFAHASVSDEDRLVAYVLRLEARRLGNRLPR